jgi:hypothetical protein
MYVNVGFCRITTQDCGSHQNRSCNAAAGERQGKGGGGAGECKEYRLLQYADTGLWLTSKPQLQCSSR